MVGWVLSQLLDGATPLCSDHEHESPTGASLGSSPSSDPHAGAWCSPSRPPASKACSQHPPGSSWLGLDIQASFGYAGLLEDAVGSYFNESFSYLSVALPVIWKKNKGKKKRTNKKLFCFYY
jgi:hypothetical protein